MKTFDYESAWRELAKPMYDALPADIIALYQRVIIETGNLTQLKNCNMPWPAREDSAGLEIEFRPELNLQQCFDSIPADILAPAARVINSYGHWHPGGVPKVPIDTVGGHWHFSNYADQSLAARLHGTLDPAWPTSNGIGYRIHEGFIRVWCGTPDSWTWEEVALATADSWERIKSLGSNTPPRKDRMTRADWDLYSDRAREFFALLKTALRPSGRIAEFLDGGYMVEESEIAARRARAVAADPNTKAKLLASINARYTDTVRKATIQRDGLLWIAEHGLDTGNAIYYDHRNVWCFGWYRDLAPETVSTLLDVLTEFPFNYEIKGYKPEVAK